MGSFDVDRTRADWFENQDPERAVHDSRAAMVELKRRRAPSDVALAELEVGIEALCDGPGGEARLAYDAALAYEGPFRDTEAEGGLHTAEQLQLRSRGQLVIAQAGYRAGFERDAFTRMLVLLIWVGRALEDGAGLVAALSSTLPSVGGAAAVRALGLYPAALRRAGYDDARTAHFVSVARPYLATYLQTGGPSGLPPIYQRTHALASQWLYLLLELVPEDPLIGRLVVLEAASRPDHARGLATAPLRDFALARRAGDAAALARSRSEARARLEAFPLERHLRTVERRGLLAA